MLLLDPNITSPDNFSEVLIESHRDLSVEQSGRTAEGDEGARRRSDGLGAPDRCGWTRRPSETHCAFARAILLRRTLHARRRLPCAATLQRSPFRRGPRRARTVPHG